MIKIHYYGKKILIVILLKLCMKGQNWDLSHNYEKKYFDFFHIYDLIYDYLNYKVLIRKNVKIMI